MDDDGVPCRAGSPVPDWQPVRRTDSTPASREHRQKAAIIFRRHGLDRPTGRSLLRGSGGLGGNGFRSRSCAGFIQFPVRGSAYADPGNGDSVDLKRDAAGQK